jgi:hypothetical protein
MNIVGLDVGRNNVTACAVTEFPVSTLKKFNQLKKEKQIARCFANKEGVERFLALKPDAVIMEPTGVWYSSFWKQLCNHHQIPIYWIGHTQLAAKRSSYGFKNKSDDEDAYCLALTYFDTQFVDYHGNKRYLKFDDGNISKIRDLFFECEQLDKILNSLINQNRQRLTLEFPEVSQKQAVVSEKLGFSPQWAYISGEHDYTRMRNIEKKSVAREIGIEISDYTKKHSKRITDLQKQLHQTEAELDKLLGLPEFEKYLKIFKKFGFGTRTASLLMVQCYPLDKFLLDGQVWVEYEMGKSKEGIPKEQKRHKSLRSFQLYLGYGYTKQQSGDGLTMKLGGSDICRSHLFAWTKACVIPQRNDINWLNKRLNETNTAPKHNTLENIKDSDQKLKQKINRLNFKITRLLFYELVKSIL